MKPEEQVFVTQRKVLKFDKLGFAETSDVIVVELPLDIRFQCYFRKRWITKNLAVTMRTPGNDRELAIGFLFSEGIVGKVQEIEEVRCINDDQIIVKLAEGLQVDADLLERHSFVSSSCGICGKTSVDKIEKVSCYFPQSGLPKISSAVLKKLPGQLRNLQKVFEQTGGIHAAGLFTPEADLLLLREDVGRHNAVDKLIGAALLQGLIPLRNHILMLSSRISFELVQKAMMAGIPVIAAVGAPSSMAIDLAKEAGITLIGFLRGNRFNIYSESNRFLIG